MFIEHFKPEYMSIKRKPQLIMTQQYAYK